MVSWAASTARTLPGSDSRKTEVQEVEAQAGLSIRQHRDHQETSSLEWLQHRGVGEEGDGRMDREEINQNKIKH